MKLSLARGALGVSCTAALLSAANAATAAPLVYTATSTMVPLVIGNSAFPLSQLNDGQYAASVSNGFGSEESSGDIVFTFASPTDLTSFSLYNNIVVDGVGGVKDFTLEFFDPTGASLGSTAYTANPMAVGAFTQPLSRAWVSRVVMHVASSLGRVEIREMAFEGGPGKPASFSRSCDDLKRRGFQLRTTTVQRSSGAQPRAGALTFGAGSKSYPYGPARPYGYALANRVFLDSFALNPAVGRYNVCRVDISVEGESIGVANNDTIAVFAPKKPNLPIWMVGYWQTSVGSVLQPGRNLTDNMGAWTYTLSVTGQGPMLTALTDDLAGVNALDILVQDDSTVKSAKLVYTLY